MSEDFDPGEEAEAIVGGALERSAAIRIDAQDRGWPDVAEAQEEIIGRRQAAYDWVRRARKAQAAEGRGMGDE